MKAKKNRRKPTGLVVLEEAENKVNELIVMTKKNYFKSKVAENRQNPKKLWNLIKNLTRVDANIRQLKEGDKIFTDK